MLQPDDYAPLQWSSDLERVARIRAMEGGLARMLYSSGHSRLNGKDIWSVQYNGVRSWAEDLAYNWKTSMVYGINQFYGEKTDWVEQRKGTVTGHYTSMIDPRYTYVGLGDFYTTAATYPNTLAAEFCSDKPGTLDSTMQDAKTGIMQKIEVENSLIKGYTLYGQDTIEVGETSNLELKVDLEKDSKSLSLWSLEPISYVSSDDSIAQIAEDGTVTGTGSGTVLITAKSGENELASISIVVNASTEEPGDSEDSGSSDEPGSSAGDSGDSGSSDQPGSAGDSGDSGSSDNPGSAGDSGSSDNSGNSDEPGSAGDSGNSGNSDNSGSAGDSGSSDNSGGTEDSGSSDGSGNAGDSGNSDEPGNAGDSGSSGDSGNSGGSGGTNDSTANAGNTDTADNTENSGSSSDAAEDTGAGEDDTSKADADTEYEKGDQVRDEDSQAEYVITKEASKSGAGGTIAYKAPVNKKAASVQIPETVTLNDTTYQVTAVAANAFKNNKSLKKVTLGANVAAIEKNAFYGCQKLKTVSIGGKVKTIGAKAFSGCKSLTKITIPAKTASIGKQAFDNCTKLKTITIKTTKLTAKGVDAKAFKGVSAKATVKVPAKAYSKYKKLLPKCGLNKKVKIVK